MALKDSDIKFFRPLWIRVTVTALCAVWCGIEIIFGHDQLWIGITGFAVGYCVYNFFWKWPKDLPAVATPAAPAPAEAIAPPAETPPDAKQP